MADRPDTAQMNGKLWGHQALDWATIQEGQFRRGYEDVLTRTGVGPCKQLLDIGCGAGMATAMAQQRGASVTGLDASEELLEIARERVPGGRFDCGDLETLPYEDNQFDVVTGFNSIQYADNPSAALAEAKRVTKPDGLVAVMTWGRPENMEAASLVTALKPLLPPPPVGAPGPFALSDDNALRAFSKSGGLTPIETVEGDSPWSYPDEATAIRGLTSSGVAARAISHSSRDAVN